MSRRADLLTKCLDEDHRGTAAAEQQRWEEEEEEEAKNDGSQWAIMSDGSGDGRVDSILYIYKYLFHPLSLLWQQQLNAQGLKRIKDIYPPALL